MLAGYVGYAQDPDVGGTAINGTVPPTGSPFANHETVSFQIQAGANSGGNLAWPAPGGTPFSVNIVTVRIDNPVVTFTGTNYFDVVITPGNTTVNSKTYTITLTQNEAIPEGEYTVFTFTGKAEGTDGQLVRYQANGSPGGYNTTNVGQDNPSSQGVIQGALPVTLTSFTAKAEGQTSQLNWATTEESNSDRFEVERSSNAKDWSMLGSLKSNGESKVLQSYSYTDAHPLSGTNYYRLKMVDRDNTYAYSRIQSLNFGEKGNGLISLYPNPVQDQIRIKADDISSIERVEILAANGQLLYRQNRESSVIDDRINVKDLRSGIYVVRLTSKDGSVTALKIIKQ